MKKVIRGKAIYFYDEKDNEIMHMDFSIDECIWFFESAGTIKITPDMELYEPLSDFMQQEYVFPKSILQNSKDNNSLVWYSDCYYDPDDEWSRDSVSCLHIDRRDDSFELWCTKELDKKFERPHRTYCICFSPCGNGNHSQNINTGATLQTDFVTHVYQTLMFKPKQMCKNRNL